MSTTTETTLTCNLCHKVFTSERVSFKMENQETAFCDASGWLHDFDAPAPATAQTEVTTRGENEKEGAMSRTEMRSKGAIQEMLAHCLIQAGKIRVGRGPGSMKRYEERSRLVLMAAVLQWVLGETITEESIAKQHAALDELEKHALAEIERNLNANRG